MDWPFLFLLLLGFCQDIGLFGAGSVGLASGGWAVAAGGELCLPP